MRRRRFTADLAPQQRLDGRQLVRVILARKADGHTRSPSTPGTADAVHVVVRYFRQGEVDHVADAVDVNTTTGHVGGYQHADLAFTEALQGLDALVLRHVARQLRSVDAISHVINFTLPETPDDYVHRIGRTGRAGTSGTSISFAGEDDAYALPAIEALLGRKIACEMPPDELLKPVPRKH